MILSVWRRFWGDRAGANAVEFALLAAPLLLILFGAVEFGRLYWAKQALQQIAITGARCMALPQVACSTSGVYDATKTSTYVRTIASTYGLIVPAKNVTLNRAATCSGITGFSTVRLTYTFSSALPNFIMGLANGPALATTSCFPNQA